ncbi:MAG: DUF3592 domain-containing protein [Alphaproteobacteria bacterium]|nr:DUF3592 domain-containing protein [Alphaproteobacteria bacterium]
MSWATLWAKAKDNHARSRRAAARGRAIAIAFIFVGAGTFNLYSDVSHHVHGKPSTATLVAHGEQCTITYQFIGEHEQQKLPLPCDVAEETQRRVGANKIKLSRDYIAHVRFALADGRLQEADVDDIKLGSHKLPIGATLPVTYAPNKPTDVRARMSWETLKVPLILLAIGLPFLAASFGISLTAPLRWLFRNRSEETATSESLAPASRTFESKAARSEIFEGRGNHSVRSDRPTGTAPRASFGMRNR